MISSKLIVAILFPALAFSQACKRIEIRDFKLESKKHQPPQLKSASGSSHELFGCSKKSGLGSVSLSNSNEHTIETEDTMELGKTLSDMFGEENLGQVSQEYSSEKTSDGRITYTDETGQEVKNGGSFTDERSASGTAAFEQSREVTATKKEKVTHAWSISATAGFDVFGVSASVTAGYNGSVENEKSFSATAGSKSRHEQTLAEKKVSKSEWEQTQNSKQSREAQSGWAQANGQKVDYTRSAAKTKEIIMGTNSKNVRTTRETTTTRTSSTWTPPQHKPYHWWVFTADYLELGTEIQGELEFVCIMDNGQERSEWTTVSAVTKAVSQVSYGMRDMTRYCPGYDQCECIDNVKSQFVTPTFETFGNNGRQKCGVDNTHPVFNCRAGCYVSKWAHGCSNGRALLTANPSDFQRLGMDEKLRYVADHGVDDDIFRWSYLPCGGSDRYACAGDRLQYCVRITTGSKSGDDGSLNLYIDGKLEFDEGLATNEEWEDCFDQLPEVEIEAGGDAWAGYVEISEDKGDTWMHMDCRTGGRDACKDGRNDRQLEDKIAVSTNGDAEDMAPRACSDGSKCGVFTPTPEPTQAPVSNCECAGVSSDFFPAGSKCKKKHPNRNTKDCFVGCYVRKDSGCGNGQQLATAKPISNEQFDWEFHADYGLDADVYEWSYAACGEPQFCPQDSLQYKLIIKTGEDFNHGSVNFKINGETFKFEDTQQGHTLLEEEYFSEPRIEVWNPTNAPWSGQILLSTSPTSPAEEMFCTLGCTNGNQQGQQLVVLGRSDDFYHQKYRYVCDNGTPCRFKSEIVSTPAPTPANQHPEKCACQDFGTPWIKTQDGKCVQHDNFPGPYGCYVRKSADCGNGRGLATRSTSGHLPLFGTSSDELERKRQHLALHADEGVDHTVFEWSYVPCAPCDANDPECVQEYRYTAEDQKQLFGRFCVRITTEDEDSAGGHLRVFIDGVQPEETAGRGVFEQGSIVLKKCYLGNSDRHGVFTAPTIELEGYTSNSWWGTVEVSEDGGANWESTTCTHGCENHAGVGGTITVVGTRRPFAVHSAEECLEDNRCLLSRARAPTPEPTIDPRSKCQCANEGSLYMPQAYLCRDRHPVVEPTMTGCYVHRNAGDQCHNGAKLLNFPCRRSLNECRSSSPDLEVSDEYVWSVKACNPDFSPQKHCVRFSTSAENDDNGDLSVWIDGNSYLDDQHFAEGEVFEKCFTRQIRNLRVQGSRDQWIGRIEISTNGPSEYTVVRCDGCLLGDGQDLWAIGGGSRAASFVRGVCERGDACDFEIDALTPKPTTKSCKKIDDKSSCKNTDGCKWKSSKCRSDDSSDSGKKSNDACCGEATDKKFCKKKQKKICGYKCKWKNGVCNRK